jgi:hypothetical protein
MQSANRKNLPLTLVAIQALHESTVFDFLQDWRIDEIGWLQTFGFRVCFGEMIDDRLNARRGWIRNGRHEPPAESPNILAKPQKDFTVTRFITHRQHPRNCRILSDAYADSIASKGDKQKSHAGFVCQAWLNRGNELEVYLLTIVSVALLVTPL